MKKRISSLEYREERGGAENEDEEQRRCALAIESMMIAAASFGLGSCYSGFGAMVKCNPEVVEALEMNENEQIYGPILTGYPKNELADALSDAL